MSGPIEEFLGEVSRGIGEVDALVLQEALAEMRGHLEESALGFEELGEDREAAERMAVAAFGSERVATEAVVKREGIFATRLSEVGWVGILLGILVSVLAFGTEMRSIPDQMVGYLTVGVIGTWMLFSILGFHKRRVLTWQIGSVVAFAFVLSSAALAPFSRISAVTGLMVTLSTFEHERTMNQTHWTEQWMIEDEEMGIMRAIDAGGGEEILRRLQTKEGYRVPRKFKGAHGMDPAYGEELSESVRLWSLEAGKVDLDMRQRLINEARTELLQKFEDASKNQIFLQWGQLLVSRWEIPAVAAGMAVLTSALGVFTRLLCDFAKKITGRGSRAIRG